MADKIRNNTFLIKRSNTPGKIPTAGSLLLGELALNTSDVILYASGTTANSILPIGWDRVSRTGDTMTGGLFTPFLSATTVSATSINRVDYIVFNTGTTSAATVPGTIYFDNTEKALSYNTSINQGVTVNLGQQNYIRVFNNSGADIPRGKALEILSAYSGLPSVTLAVNKHEGFNIIGVSSEIIPNGKEGVAITYGIISNIELTGMTVGSLIYASDNVPGKLDDATKYLTFPLTARTNEVGFVVQTGVTTGKLFVNINNENSVLSLTDLERNVLEGNTLSTGVFDYSGMTKTSSTTFNIAPLKGWVVNNTYENALRPNVTAINYSGVTGQTTPYLLTDVATYVLINSASTLTLINTFPTPQQRRQNIFLGRVAHPDKLTIVTVNNTVDFDVSPMSALRDLWTPLKLINENIIISPNGANLSFNNSAGTLWGNGIGWAESQLNPNSISISASTPVTFQYRTQTGGTYGNTTLIDPANYDLNGVLTPVGGGANSSTNQRIYAYPNKQFRVQYGQKVYASLSEAVIGVQTEVFTTFVNNRDNAILIGILSVNKNATQLNNTTQGIFTFVSKFGELLGGTGGLSTTTLQQAYDNSSNPEIVINATLDGLSIKNGTGNADNITRLLEGINTTGSVTSFINADGDISGTTLQTNSFIANSNGVTANTLNLKTVGSGIPVTNLGIDYLGNVVSGTTGGSTFTGGTVTGPTFFTNGLTANTISATTYYNLPIDVYSTGGTYNGGNVYITNNTGGTFTITGLTATGFSANYYGSFSDTTTQPILSANTPIAWTYNTTELSNGISVVNNSRIKVANKGVYEIGYSAQIERLVGGTPADVTIWARLNGNNVIRTSSTLSFANNSTYQLPFVSFMFEMEANDYVEFYFSSPDTNIQITTLSGLTSPTRPVAPSVIIVAKQIGLSVTDNLGGYYLPLSGGTVSGQTIFNSGLTANTISANTISATTITGGTIYGNGSGLTNIPINGVTNLQSSLDNKFDKSGGTVTGSVLITGDVTILGTATTINTQTLTVKDNIITINSNYSGNTAPYPGTSGIEVLRASATTATLLWDESSQKWVAGLTGNTKQILLSGDSLSLLNSGHTHPISEIVNLQSSLDSKFDKSGGVVSGNTLFTNGITATTISATTYLNLPLDIRVTGGTYSAGTATFTNNTGGTFNVTGFSTSTATAFTGGTVTGATNFTGGVTANTISATTYFNLPTDVRVTGATYSNNTFTYTNNTGGTFNVLFNTVTGLTVNGNLTVTGNTSLQALTGTSAVFSGSGANILTVIGSGSTTSPIFSVQGSTGATIFSISDSTSGPLFWVDTLTDVPVIEVYDTSPQLIVYGGISASTITASTISATTYFNLPLDIRVTGATYSNNTFTYTNNTGGTFNVLFNTVTGLTVNGNLTVTGNTSLQALTATTISATTYSNLPSDIRVTGASYNNNTFTYTNNTGGTFSVLFNTMTGLTVNGTLSATTIYSNAIGVKTTTPSFDLEVNGTFGATSKSFVIKHPTQEGKKLVYGAIEGPEFGVYVRGKVYGNIIELPEEWVGLVDENSITVQLTGDGLLKLLYVKNIKDNKVYISNMIPFVKPTGYYTVYGERKDIDKIKKVI